MRKQDKQGISSETLADYWWCTLQALSFDGGKGPNVIVDDGGDATMMIHVGYDAENNAAVLDKEGLSKYSFLISPEWEGLTERLPKTLMITVAADWMILLLSMNPIIIPALKRK